MANRSKAKLLQYFRLFSVPDGGIGSWLTGDTDDYVFERLSTIEQEPLSKVQLNQLLAFAHEAPLSVGFFRYYWLTTPERHPYIVTGIPLRFDASWGSQSCIVSLDHLSWGLYRLYTDGLLWFGNVRTAYRKLRTKSFETLEQFFTKRRFDTDALKARGPALDLHSIARDDRYLISEMACKSYGNTPTAESELRNALVTAFRAHKEMGRGRVKIRDLLKERLPSSAIERQGEFMFSADDVLEQEVDTEEELRSRYEAIAAKFSAARESGLKNTYLYLSMVGELDVYVATSMRTRQDFRKMADFCDSVFGVEKLKDLVLRYFDPTMSAAEGHEDKGLIECLMVKCAKVLVYCAGEKDSYGKDAEAAMGLSLGKPVIFYCDKEQRSRFYRDVHPLSRLIEFETGIAVGAMVTSVLADVDELLFRIFENRMEYELEQPKPGYLRLKERLTGSVIRVQTSDRMLGETFWNYYHNKPED